MDASGEALSTNTTSGVSSTNTESEAPSTDTASEQITTDNKLLSNNKTLQVEATKASSDVIIISLESGDGKTGYLTGETMTVQTKIDLSQVTNNIVNPYLEFVVPNTYASAISPATFTGATYTIDTTSMPGYSIIRYKFTQLVSDTTLSVPVIVTSKSYDTPDNYVCNISSTLYAADGTVLHTTNDLQLTQQVIAPTLTKARYFAGPNSPYGDMRFADGSIGFGGIADSTNPNLIVMDGAALQTFGFWHKWPGSSTSIGNRRYAGYIIRDTLPAGAVFDPNNNPGWTYDSITRVATYIYTSTNGFVWDGANTSAMMPTISVSFPGGSISNTYTNTTELEMIPKNQQSYEEVFTSSDSLSFLMNNVLPTPGFTKERVSPYPGSVVDGPTDKRQPLIWRLSLQSKASSLNMENISITDYDLDMRLYFSSIKLDTSQTGYERYNQSGNDSL